MPRNILEENFILFYLPAIMPRSVIRQLMETDGFEAVYWLIFASSGLSIWSAVLVADDMVVVAAIELIIVLTSN